MICVGEDLGFSLYAEVMLRAFAEQVRAAELGLGCPKGLGEKLTPTEL